MRSIALTREKATEPRGYGTVTPNRLHRILRTMPKSVIGLGKNNHPACNVVEKTGLSGFRNEFIKHFGLMQ